jgi:hypothetical protein
MLICRQDVDYKWTKFNLHLELASIDVKIYLNPDLKKHLDLDNIYRYIGYHYYGDDVTDVTYLDRLNRTLLGYNNTDGLDYRSYLLSLMSLSRARQDYGSYRQKVDSGEIVPVNVSDIRSLFDIYRYASETNVVQLMEDLNVNVDDIPSIVGERWSYMYSGYYGDVTQAKTLVKGKYAQLLLDYALIGNQPDIVRLCVTEGVNVSRYFDLRPSLVLELKPPNWEFYAIETGDLDVIAKTLESPNSLAINRAFGHVDVVEAMSKQK